MRPSEGFTLIELLVTISVIGVVLALIGPFGMEQLERTRRISEQQSLEQFLENQQKSAFLHGRPAELTFSGRDVIVTAENRVTEDMEFRELFFPPQSIFIDAHGMSSAEQLKFNTGTRELYLNLNQQAGL